MNILLKKIAHLVDGEVIGDDSLEIMGINSLDAAKPGEISFFVDRRYKKSLVKTGAGAIIVAKKTDLFKGAQVVVPNPGLAYARVTGLFATPIPRFPGVSEHATVPVNCSLGKNISVYPSVYIGDDVLIGDDVTIFPGTFIGDRVKIGDRTVIYPNVSIMQDCVVGNDVVIHAGTIIGSDGFGFVLDGSTSVKVPQIGTVRIDDNVEIGANCCIDRAAIGETWIKKGVKIDNQVQVAHNVVIGEDTIVVAQAGISGSVTIGREATIGPKVGIIDHMEIGDRVMIGGKAGVAKSIPPGEIVSGYPTMPHRLWLKTSHIITRLPRLIERLRGLERRMEKLEKQK
ncbi:MAG: UDP-3-O-(3-hydroxymyristoyl)glucosamine N-acyltransferase [Desulfobacterales bacterium]|nr:UDP-3-O-(3-hydroxymyristoyl)glucosamine N-acyltransferase [Desulfobacterales bacterium]